MTKHKAYEISHHKKLDNEQFEDNLSLAKIYNILIYVIIRFLLYFIFTFKYRTYVGMLPMINKKYLCDARIHMSDQ